MNASLDVLWLFWSLNSSYITNAKYVILNEENLKFPAELRVNLFAL